MRTVFEGKRGEWRRKEVGVHTYETSHFVLVTQDHFHGDEMGVRVSTLVLLSLFLPSLYPRIMEVTGD